MSFRILLSPLILFFSLSLTSAHLCLWKPMQRGNFSLHPLGSHDCYRKIAPCGGFNSSTSKQRTVLHSGSNYTVEFQQHLNHYYPPNPGQLDISFAVGLDPSEDDFHVLTSFNDYNPMNHNTQTNFSIEVQLPNIECEHCVLRVRYLTNNLDEKDHGKTFYQCSDIQLVDNSNSISKLEDKNGSHDCCAPSSFQMSYIHWMEDALETSLGKIYYDQSLKQMYISMLVKNVEYNMWMNFTSGKQYLNNVNEKSCRLLDLDQWNDWCFGNSFNQSEDFLYSNKPCLSDEYKDCNQWQNGDFLFESTIKDCYPSSLIRLSNNERTIYFNQEKGPIPIEIFQPDPICFQTEKGFE